MQTTLNILFSQLVDEFGSFCNEIGALSSDPNLRLVLAEKFASLEEKKKLFEDHILREDMPKGLVRTADDEIFRRPLNKVDEFSDRPIFIVGNRRSGTTLLSYLINATDNICALPEAFFGQAIVESQRLFAVGHSLAYVLNEPFHGFVIRLGKLLDEIYTRYAAANHKSRWAAKELFISNRLDLLDQMFDYRAKFLYVIRHGFDVAYSCASRFPKRDGLRFDPSTSLNLDVFLNEWINNNEATMDFYERNRARCLLVRYEDLTMSPEAVGQRVFDFLGERWRPSSLEAMEEQQLRPMMGDHKIICRGLRIQTSNSSWKDWPAGLKRTLARKANATLERLGYEPVTSRMGDPDM